MAKKKYVSEKSDAYQLVDIHTGELLDYNQIKRVTIEEFIMVYLASIPDMFVLTGHQIKLMMAIWRLSCYNKALHEDGNIFLNDPDSKRAIREMGLNMSDSTIDTAIYHIAKEGFMTRISKGKYRLNPKYFFMGTLSDRSKLQLKILVEPTNTSKNFLVYGVDLSPIYKDNSE